VIELSDAQRGQPDKPHVVVVGAILDVGAQ